MTHHRDSRPNDVVRKTSFAYDATTGLLKEERTQPGGAVDQDVRKLYTLDSYGNRTATIVCLPTASTCDPANLGFHQTTLTGLHRYSRTDYSASGRFPVTNWEPFWNGGSGSGTTLAMDSSCGFARQLRQRDGGNSSERRQDAHAVWPVRPALSGLEADQAGGHHERCQCIDDLSLVQPGGFVRPAPSSANRCSRPRRRASGRTSMRWVVRS